MGNLINLLAVALLTFTFIVAGNGLQCYSCAYVEAGNLDLISGFETATQDSSCVWGGEPDAKLLVTCPGSDEPQAGLDHTCVLMRLNGKLVGGTGNLEFNGTLRGCASRKKPEVSPEQLFSEYKQGVLADVTMNFEDLTGKQFLQNLSTIFDGTETRAKFVSCNANKCIFRDESFTDSTEPGTGGTDATTPDHSGASVQIVNWLGIIVLGLAVCSH